MGCTDLFLDVMAGQAWSVPSQSLVETEHFLRVM